MAAHRKTGTPTHHNQARGQSNARKHTATKQQLLPYPGAHASCLLLLASTTLKTRLVHELRAGWAAVDGPAQIEPHPSMRPHTYTLPSLTCCRCTTRWAPLGRGFSRCRSRKASARVSAAVPNHNRTARGGEGGEERGCEGGRNAVVNSYLRSNGHPIHRWDLAHKQHWRRSVLPPGGREGGGSWLLIRTQTTAAVKLSSCQHQQEHRSTINNRSPLTAGRSFAHLWIEQQVLRLDIAMADAERVNVRQGPCELVEVQLHEEHRKRLLALVVSPRHAVHRLRHELQDQVKVQLVRLGAGC